MDAGPQTPVVASTPPASTRVKETSANIKRQSATTLSPKLQHNPTLKLDSRMSPGTMRQQRPAPKTVAANKTPVPIQKETTRAKRAPSKLNELYSM